MTAFVILAAGRGTRMGRVGDSLHKALAPLAGRAVISHLIELAPPDARVIICTGYRSDQVVDYVSLAHPDRDVTYVQVPGWDEPGGGPGHSLLWARDVVGDDRLIFTSCDTIWSPDDELWKDEDTWAAVAPIPTGTTRARWCRLVLGYEDEYVHRIYDKTDDYPDGGRDFAYVGLASISRIDLQAFWDGVERGTLISDERQVTGGLASVDLKARRVRWTDVGDEESYQRAVATYTGYDWTKTDEATYVLPETGRVVKFWADPLIMRERAERAWMLGGAVPRLVDHNQTMIAYEYVEGDTCYETAEWDPNLVHKLLTWGEEKIWRPVHVSHVERHDAAIRFYRDKTIDRIFQLRPALRDLALDAYKHITLWSELIDQVEPVIFHGDFNFGNIIHTDRDTFVGIDWRQDFGGQTKWGDKRYDIAKLLGGMVIHWDHARRGDFRPWETGPLHINALNTHYPMNRVPHDVMTIMALSLINSAPLHAAPLDEVLVSRGVAFLEELR